MAFLCQISVCDCFSLIFSSDMFCTDAAAVEAKRRVLRGQKKGVKNPKLAKLGVTTVWHYLLLLSAFFSSVLVVAGSSRGVFPANSLCLVTMSTLMSFDSCNGVCYCFLLLVKVNPPCSLNTKVSVPRQRPAQVPAFRTA